MVRVEALQKVLVGTGGRGRRPVIVGDRVRGIGGAGREHGQRADERAGEQGANGRFGHGKLSFVLPLTSRRSTSLRSGAHFGNLGPFPAWDSRSGEGRELLKERTVGSRARAIVQRTLVSS